MSNIGDLKSLILEVIEQYPDAQADELAQHVAKMTDKHDLSRFYEQSLRPFIGEVIRSSRNRTVDNFFHSKPPKPIKEGQPLSYKVAAFAAWGQLMKEKVPTEEGLKTLGECTISDLDYIIQIRRDHISRMEEKVNQYTMLRDHMKKYHAPTLNDAPEMKL